MAEPHDEARIPELEELRAPQRTADQRLRLRERILAEAAPRLARRQRPATWDVLAGWARPGLAAAAVALALVLGALELGGDRGRTAAAPAGLDQVLAAGTENGRVPALLVAINEPDADAVVEAALLEANYNEGESR